MLRWSRHLGVHLVIQIPTSEAVQSISSLLPQLKVCCIGFIDIYTEIVTAGLRRKIFDVMTFAHLVEARLMVEFWSDGLNPIHIVTCIALIFICIDYILPLAYNHFIISTICQQLASADLSLRDQTRHFISEAIQYGATYLPLSLVFLMYKPIYRRRSYPYLHCGTQETRLLPSPHVIRTVVVVRLRYIYKLLYVIHHCGVRPF
jgi:hypothetical protein